MERRISWSVWYGSPLTTLFLVIIDTEVLQMLSQITFEVQSKCQPCNNLLRCTTFENNMLYQVTNITNTQFIIWARYYSVDTKLEAKFYFIESFRWYGDCKTPWKSQTFDKLRFYFTLFCTITSFLHFINLPFPQALRLAEINKNEYTFYGKVYRQAADFSFEMSRQNTTINGLNIFFLN